MPQASIRAGPILMSKELSLVRSNGSALGDLSGDWLTACYCRLETVLGEYAQRTHKRGTRAHPFCHPRPWLSRPHPRPANSRTSHAFAATLPGFLARQAKQTARESQQGAQPWERLQRVRHRGPPSQPKRKALQRLESVDNVRGRFVVHAASGGAASERHLPFAARDAAVGALFGRRKQLRNGQGRMPLSNRWAQPTPTIGVRPQNKAAATDSGHAD